MASFCLGNLHAKSVGPLLPFQSARLPSCMHKGSYNPHPPGICTERLLEAMNQPSLTGVGMGIPFVSRLADNERRSKRSTSKILFSSYHILFETVIVIVLSVFPNRPFLLQLRVLLLIENVHSQSPIAGFGPRLRGDVGLRLVVDLFVEGIFCMNAF